MNLQKLSFMLIILVLTIFLSGCSASLSGKIDITNKRLESGETTNMYLTIIYAKNTFGGKPQDITIQFSSGEGLEIIKDGQVITEDKIENLDGGITKVYTVRARAIRAQQITDSVTVRIYSGDNKALGMISDLITVTPRMI